MITPAKILLLIILPSLCFGQLKDNFNDGNLQNDVVWSGDLGNYIINNDGQLQLNAFEAGTSILTTPLSFPTSFQFDVYIDQSFNPSGSNFGEIIIGADAADLNGNLMLLQLGENGSEDALTLIEQIGGSKQEIGRGTPGLISQNNVRIWLRVILLSDNLIEVYLSEDGQIYDLEIITTTSLDFSNMSIFGLRATYTSTRVDKFKYDDLCISAYSPDIDPPTLVKAEALNENTVVITFNEPIDQQSISASNLTIDQGVGQAISVQSLPARNQLEVTFDAEFNGRDMYEITVNEISDTKGNFLISGSTTFKYAQHPEAGQLTITEILFNPEGDGSDYVELFNNSEFDLQLEGLMIENKDKSESQILDRYTLKSFEYVAITEDRLSTSSFYKTPDSANLFEQNLPSFNNDEGNVSLTSTTDNWTETFDYDENFHNVLLDDVDGVSLERLSIRSEINDPMNWRSAIQATNYGTPGYANANRLRLSNTSGFSLESKKFSPNLDGFEDEMRLLYKLDSPGQLLNLDVYNSEGFKVKSLADNVLLGSEGVITWNGTDDSGSLLPVGIYIIIGESFSIQGEKDQIKQTITLINNI